MRYHAIKTLVIFLALGPILRVSAQQPKSGGSPQADRQTVVVNTSEVRLDAVVKDKKGRPVKDLTAADFEVYEEGVRQEILSFRQVGGVERRVAPGAAANEARPSAMEGGPETLGPNYVALVFDRLSPGARVLAHDAAVKFVSEGMKPNDFVGVFGTALNFKIFQQYTNNSQAISAGIERASLQTGGEFQSSRQQLRQLRGGLKVMLTGGSSAEAGNLTIGGGSLADAALLKSQIQILETLEDFESDRQGYATTDGLLALVNSLKDVKGRKSVIFFSEGITIPANVQTHFLAVIGSANRVGVTIYTVDGAGLRIESATAETRREIESRADARLGEIGTADEGSNGPMTQGLERNERVLTLDPDNSLGRLADQTGGMYLHNSNDLKARMGQIGDDLNSYYVLTYVPQNRTFDGKFRKTEVKLKRAGLDIQSRKGYFAINSADTSPVLEFEAPALAAASSASQPHDLPIKSIALAFPEPERLGLVLVLAELPLSTISFKSDQQKKQYATDFTLVTLIKNAQGQIVRKLSKQYLLAGELDKLPLTQKEQVLYYRETDLEPGHYTIQTVVYDALANKAGVKEGSLDLAASSEASDENLRLSSLVILGRAEKLSAADKTQANPLQVGELQAYPSLAEIHKQATKQLTFYFSVYQGKSAENNVPKITIELMQNGRSLGQIPGEAPPADATGRRQFIGALPLETIPPGSYEMKVTVSEGKNSVSSSRRFLLAM